MHINPSQCHTCIMFYYLYDLFFPSIEQELISNPYETKSDSFYFVDGQLIMHHRADYAYNDWNYMYYYAYNICILYVCIFCTVLYITLDITTSVPFWKKILVIKIFWPPHCISSFQYYLCCNIIRNSETCLNTDS